MECLLVSEAGAHSPLPLPPGTARTLGRGPDTRITDRRCSRRQVQLVADYKSKSVLVKQLGTNPTSVNGQVLSPGSEAVWEEGATLHLVNGQYPYSFCFRPSEPAVHQPPSQSDCKRARGGAAEEPTVPSKKACMEESRQEEVVRGGVSKAPAWPQDTWIEDESLLVFTKAGVCARSKFAGFDIDGTIITTKSGKVFPTGVDDWRILYPEIPKRLKQLFQDGYKLVFFTNQRGISRGKLHPQDFQRKVEAVISKLGVPVQVYVSTGLGFYRKPLLGMLDHLRKQGNDRVEIDLDKCLYVGDAAGRPPDWAPGRKKKDFSCSDRLFALNAGIPFNTPEEFFLGWKPATFRLPEFDPRKMQTGLPQYEPPSAPLTVPGSELIVAVGFPGSGKSTFIRDFLVTEGYVYANRDTLGSWQKCVSVCEAALGKGKRAVVDNTNLDLESRSRYTECARKAGVPCRCFLFTTSFEHSKHNIRFREMTYTGDGHAPVNEVVMNSSRKRYAEPTLSEGFSAILRINFLPRFRDAKLQEHYHLFSEG
ncbi:bifunctional polynucleotide phosphatase/kinase isoform X1 [Hypanus sabinus]|uniref:bifunctional polynucleotide phosphatase/kinase isoform X1 n=1 Tax=Hypanus sabinus TaxID=79690 RepID=UPI0028C3A8F4|nr:bifunctional polynucleotide phosphatase/kinase isoform X1 [Hypanus sabinus]